MDTTYQISSLHFCHGWQDEAKTQGLRVPVGASKIRFSTQPFKGGEEVNLMWTGNFDCDVHGWVMWLPKKSKDEEWSCFADSRMDSFLRRLLKNKPSRIYVQFR